MKNLLIPRFAVLLFLTVSILSPNIAAQTRRQGPAHRPAAQQRVAPKEPVPTFDTLLAADSYKVYGEIRGVGQLVRSTGVNDLLNPVIKFAAPPKEFRTLVKWLSAHADELMTSRLLFAGGANRPKLPQFFCAIEFASEEEAAKFQPQLNNVLLKLLPTPAPSPSPGASPATSAEKKGTASIPESKAESPPPYLIRHTGTLVLISDTKFSFSDLRPVGSKLLRDDQKFRLVHDRFISEPLFFYVNVETPDRSQQQPEAEKAQIVEESMVATPEELPPMDAGDSELVLTTPLPAQPENSPSTESSGQPVLTVAEVEQSKGPPPFNLLRLTDLLFDGRPRWPEAVGVGIGFDAETYVIRALLLNSEENKSVVIPFMPQLLSGPPLSPSAATIFPADTEMFVTASVDFVQIHDNMIRTAQRQQEQAQQRQGRNVNLVSPPTSPFENYEKTLGISFKKDLFPLLGNEVAWSIPMKTIFSPPPTYQEESATPSAEPTGPSAKPQEPPEEPAFILAVALRDREGMRALLPRVIDSLAIKGASLLAQTERREDTELVTYGNVLSYAFVGDFLVSSPNPKALRRLIDSYLNRQTLASESNFNGFTRWQSRQLLGQVYVSTALTESYENYTEAMNAIGDEQLRDFITNLTPTNEPITYSLTNEGSGPLHELHLPRKLVLLMIAGMAAGSQQSSLGMNESMAQGSLQMIASAQQSFKTTKGNGSFGSLQELIDAGLIPADSPTRYGYRIEVIASGSTFEARATPSEYGKTGKRSYFIDESLVLRAGDHGGGPATLADKALH